jgi:hypothetical protein
MNGRSEVVSKRRVLKGVIVTSQQAVGIVQLEQGLDYRLDNRGNVVHFLARAREFLLLQNVHMSSGAHPVACSVGYQG